MGTSTPWGVADSSRCIARGIMEYGTPSHGGFHLSKSRQAQMPAALRLDHGWYEEDCDYARVVLGFPQFFSGEEIAGAMGTVRNWFPDAFEAFTGRTLAPGESHVKDDRDWKAANADKYQVLAGYGDWHEGVPEGQVGVFAGLGGRLPNGRYPDDRHWFLVPQPVYRAVTPGRLAIAIGDYPEWENHP